jgi:5'-nucleotidase
MIMAWSPEDSLVIGISSRALFDLDEEDGVYREKGTQSFIDHQQQHEQRIIEPGVAFSLVKALLGLNSKLGVADRPAIEVVIVSKNHPDCSLRVRKSLEHYHLPIKRAMFTGGQPILPFLRALNVDLFLSKEESAVKEALQAGYSAGRIFGGPSSPVSDSETPVVAFDGDSVLFSGEADQTFKEKGLAGFAESELANAAVPLQPGPLRRFAHALSELQAEHPIDKPPFRIALVTARDITYCERPIRTLRSWGIRMDQGFFVSDMSKRFILAALNPLIFFDDSMKNCHEAASCTPTVHVPQVVSTASAADSSVQFNSARPERFAVVCKLFLKKDFASQEQALLQWYETHLPDLSEENFVGFVAEMTRSLEGTPAGRQRRSSSAKNSSGGKLLLFLNNLIRKYTRE